MRRLRPGETGYNQGMNTRRFFGASAMACLALGIGARSARADAWALLIGVNEYEDRNHIASLGTADQDAIALKNMLMETMKVSERHIDLLVTDPKAETPKPTRSNILASLARLKNNARPGDTVYVFFSGHGICINNITDYLLPYDFQGNADTGIDTALSVARFYELLSQVKARAVIVAWDKCRNDPFSSGKGADGKRNALPEDMEKREKGWNVVSAANPKPAPPKEAPPILVKFFACSPGQTAFEWRAKGRGYFSYYFEKGLRGAAADKSGKVTVTGLTKYLESEVQAQVMRDESEEQTPYPQIDGTGAVDFVLAGEGGDLPPAPEIVAMAKREPAPVSTPPNDLKKPVPPDVARLVVETNVLDMDVTLNDDIHLSGISEASFNRKPIFGVVHDFRADKAVEVRVRLAAPGLKLDTYTVRLSPGRTSRLSLIDPERPRIASLTSDVLGARAAGQPAAVTKLLAAHRAEKLAALGKLRLLVDPPHARRKKPEALLLAAGLTDAGEENVLTPLWQTLSAIQEGRASFSEHNGKLDVTGGDAAWEISMDSEGRIERLERTAGGKTLKIRILKYKEFEDVPMPLQFQADTDGKVGIFNVKSIVKL